MDPYLKSHRIHLSQWQLGCLRASKIDMIFIILVNAAIIHQYPAFAFALKPVTVSHNARCLLQRKATMI